ncbi:MAG: HD domain-containing protein, partial [Anaerolineales bacterium]
MATVTPVKDSALDEILAALPESSTPADKVLVERAFKFASQEHVGQVRASGQPYLNHCVAVALLLADLNLPPVAVAAGLLHDVVEDTHITIENIEAEFGEAIARMVDGVTKLTQRVERMDRARPDTAENGFGMTDRQAETIRKTLLAMEDDVRVVLIKLADRLHNMRTLRHLPAQKQRRIAQETLDIFAPLANRLGIWQIKWELEDLGLRYTQPTRYKEIVGEINARRAQRERIVQQIVERLQAALDEHGLNAT